MNITDKSYQPSLEELVEYMHFPLFEEMYAELMQKYKVKYEIAFSGDNVQPGWNIKMQKSGRALVRVYPRPGSFVVLIVIGRREKEQVELLLPQMSEAIQAIYHNTQEGMGQRWLMFPIEKKDDLYRDLMTLIDIRKKS